MKVKGRCSTAPRRIGWDWEPRLPKKLYWKTRRSPRGDGESFTCRVPLSDVEPPPPLPLNNWGAVTVATWLEGWRDDRHCVIGPATMLF